MFCYRDLNVGSTFSGLAGSLQVVKKRWGHITVHHITVRHKTVHYLGTLQNGTMQNGSLHDGKALQNGTWYTILYRTVRLHNGKRYKTVQRYKTVRYRKT